MASMARKIEPPVPPHCSGTSTPMSPSSKNFAIRSGRNFPASSISATWGRTSVSANSRTVSRKSSSSSERVVRARDIKVSGMQAFQLPGNRQQATGRKTLLPAVIRVRDAGVPATSSHMSRTPIKTYRDLVVWDKAMDLGVAVHQFCEERRAPRYFVLMGPAAAIRRLRPVQHRRGVRSEESGRLHAIRRDSQRLAVRAGNPPLVGAENRIELVGGN